MGVVVVIPTLDPGSRIVSLVSELQQRGFGRFIVVDDGSAERCQPVFDALEARDVVVLHHRTNLGKGQAIKTAILKAGTLYPDVTHVVTMDDDGQHLPRDVEEVCRVAALRPGAVVLGTRDLGSAGVPLRSRLGNAFSTAYFKMDTGMNCPDTQTGLRAIPASLFGLALSTPGYRYDYEMNFLTAVVKRGIPVDMVPIATVYDNRNKASHFSTVRDSLLIYQQLFRFAGSSLACSCVDLGMFALIAALVNLDTAVLVAVATVAARVVSGALNFRLNRQWSFRGSGSMLASAGSEAMRYAMLFACQMLASIALVELLAGAPIPLVGVKALVDSALFVVSYFVQRNWVFKAPARAQAFVAKGGGYVEDGSRSGASALR